MDDPFFGMGLQNITFSFNRASPQYASCDIIEIPFKGEKTNNAFAFQKHSPYVELFNNYIKKMEEKGIIHQILVGMFSHEMSIITIFGHKNFK